MNDHGSDKAWFAPKQFGYGAGLPIAWQGWVMIALHMTVIAVGMAALRHSHHLQTTWIIVAAALPLPLYAAKTRGGWQWRWGNKP